MSSASCSFLRLSVLMFPSRRRDDFDAEDLDSSFSYDDDRFGETITIDLVPGGHDIPLRNSNKQEYVT